MARGRPRAVGGAGDRRLASAEIDTASAAGVGQRLCAAFASRVTMVIADLTSTVFCDSSGVSQLVLAYHCAAAHNAQLRLVVPHPNVLGVPTVVGLDRMLRVYPTLDAALSAAPGPESGASRS
jgi:anti-sigma B factor antagonist